MSSDSRDTNQPPTELARRLRDEVRAEAQREADAIISKARSDIKEIVSSAYAELLVLRAQVQAITDEKVDHTLPPSIQQFETEAENLRRQLGHSGVEQTASPRGALPEPQPEHHRHVEPQPEPEREPAGVFASSYVDSSEPRPSRRIVPTAAAVAVLAVAALWFFVRPGGGPEQFGAGSTGVSPAATETPTTPAPATPDPLASQPAAEPPPTDPGAAAAPETAGTFPAGTVTLELRATRDVWVRADVDGSVDNGRIYSAGEAWTLGPAKAVALRVGDGGALTVSVNGAAAAPAGADGVVVNRRYGESPVAAPAPAPETPPAAQPATVAAAPPPPSPTIPSVPIAAATPPAAPAERLDAEIRALDRRWFDAMYRGDETTLRLLRAPSFQANDSRGPLTRPPQGGEVQRTVGQAGVTMVGEDAVLAGRMVETVAGAMPIESLFSEIWVRTGDGWRLSELRIQPAPPNPPR